jgi:hypothetical protein
VFSIAWRRGRRALVAPLPHAFVLLPWHPIPQPAAFQIRSGAIVSALWVATAAGLAAPWVRAAATRLSVSFDARRHCALAGMIACAAFALAAWHAAPAVPSGDEPQYLVITQSLLADHDLQIQNNIERGDYRAYFSRDIGPGFNRRGRNGAIYSIHAPGLSALVLPAFAIGGYRAVVVFLIVVAAAGAGLAWWLAWRLTEDVAAAWFGWAAVALTAPFLLESFTIYPDGVGATVVLTGVWALVRTDFERESNTRSWMPWLWHGVALALLPWLHTRLAVIAATLGGVVLIRLARSPNAVAKASAFLAVPAMSALAWLMFFVVIYGTPDPSAPYGGQTGNSLAYLPDGLGGLLFDQGFGLFATAPVLCVAVAGFTRTRRFAAEWLVVAVPYMLAVATFAMWWAGASAPARFLVPLLLPLAIPAACAWAGARSRAARVLMLAALATSVWMAAVMDAGGGGRLGFHSRAEAGMTRAPWIEWAVPLVDLPSTLPAFVPTAERGVIDARMMAARRGAAAAVPWIIGFGALGFVCLRFAGRISGTALASAATLGAALVVMVCAAFMWRMDRAAPIVLPRGQLEVLRAAASDHVLVSLTGRRRRTGARFASAVEIEVPVEGRVRGRFRPDRPLAMLPLVPAGEYELTARASGDDGVLMAGVARDQYSILTAPLAVARAGVRLRLPVDVRSLVVRADDLAQDEIRSIVLRPVRLFRASEQPTRALARRAVRYGGSVLYFLDGSTYPEPSGFWVGRDAPALILIAPDAPNGSATLHLRNAAVVNHVTIEDGANRRDLPLAPDEECDVAVAIDPVRRAALVRITSSAGVQPAAAQSGRRDSRSLGVFVRFVG